MRAQRAAGGKGGAKKRVKRTGPRALQAFLQNHFERPVVARECGGAIFRTHQPPCRTRAGAVGAEREAAIGTHGDGFSLVRSAFHAALKLRHARTNCKPETILTANPREVFANRRLAESDARRDGWFTMKTMNRLALLAIPAALALAFTTIAKADGQATYADNCAKCHGDDGKGATKMGQKLGAKDYTDAAVQTALTDDQAFKSVKEGLKKDDKTLMKPSELSDDDIKAAIAYLRTFKK